MINLTPWAIGWLIVVAILVGQVVYRRSLAKTEDDSIHVSEFDSDKVGQQTAFADKLQVVDRWGKILAGITAIYALGLLAAYMYNGWLESSGVRFS